MGRPRKETNPERLPVGVVQPVAKLWLSQPEAAFFMGCTEEWLRKNVRYSGEVAVSKEKGMYWYLLSDLNRFIASRNVLK